MRHRHSPIIIHILWHENLRRNVETEQLRIDGIEETGYEGCDEGLRTAQDGGVGAGDGKEGTKVGDAG